MSSSSTSVLVAARVRPLNTLEKREGNRAIFSVRDGNTVVETSSHGGSPSGKVGRWPVETARQIRRAPADARGGMIQLARPLQRRSPNKRASRARVFARASLSLSPSL